MCWLIPNVFNTPVAKIINLLAPARQNEFDPPEIKRSSMNFGTTICRCGAFIVKTSCRHKYCEECRKIRRTESKVEFYQKIRKGAIK